VERTGAISWRRAYLRTTSRLGLSLRKEHDLRRGEKLLEDDADLTAAEKQKLLKTC